MEKLIELLNEWQQSFNPGYEFTYKYNKESARKDLNNLSQLKLFIKWLVENNKIDKKKIWAPIIHYKIEEDREGGIHYYDLDFANKVNGLLMRLAISDTPIEDLISYLK